MADRGRDAVRGLGNEMHVTDALGEGGEPEKPASEQADERGASRDEIPQQENARSDDQSNDDRPG